MIYWRNWNAVTNEMNSVNRSTDAQSEVAFWCFHTQCLMQLRGDMNVLTLHIELHKYYNEIRKTWFHSLWDASLCCSETLKFCCGFVCNYFHRRNTAKTDNIWSNVNRLILALRYCGKHPQSSCVSRCASFGPNMIPLWEKVELVT